jgi:hypothetical protein
MKISEAVGRTLQGDGIVTGRDDKGLYVEYTRIAIDLGRCVMTLWNGSTELATLKFARPAPTDLISLDGVEGRMRITL